MIDILYEHPAWFARLFEALDVREVPYRRVHAASLRFTPDWKHDPAAREAAPDLLVNRMSPSADRRGHGRGILPTLQYLESAEAGGVRVINGSKAYGFEISKARQMALLADLGLPFPKTRVINSAAEALAATEGLRWPVVVKPSVGGSGAGVLRVDRRERPPRRGRGRTARFRRGPSGPRAGVHPRQGLAHHARGGARRHVPLRHPRTGDGAEFQPVPGRPLRVAGAWCRARNPGSWHSTATA